MVENALTEDQKKGRARTRAFKRLREQFPDSWHKFLGEEMGAEGLEYTPPKSKQQKAAEEALVALSAVREDITLADVMAFMEAKASVELSRDPRMQTHAFDPDLPDPESLGEVEPPPLTEGDEAMIAEMGEDPAEDFERNDFENPDADPDEPR